MGALSCCECKTCRCWRRRRLRAVVRAVMLSDCCAGAPCRDMGSCAGRIMWPSRDRALLTARAGCWERLESSWLRLVRDWVSACVWDGGVATGCVEGWCDAGGSAERVCEGGDDAAASAGEGAWGSWKEKLRAGGQAGARRRRRWLHWNLHWNRRREMLQFFCRRLPRPLFSEPLLALIFCPGGSAGGKLTFQKNSFFAGGSGHG